VEKSSFYLIGFDCPFGRYPALLVPIVSDREGKYGAVYLSKDFKVCIDEIPAESEFSRIEGLDSRSQKQLERFDYQIHKLFALSETELRFYSARSEKEFFKTLLTEESALLDCDPFIRLSLAELTEDRDIWSSELLRCDQYIQEHLADSLPIWEINREEIRARIKSLPQPERNSALILYSSEGARAKVEDSSEHQLEAASVDTPYPSPAEECASLLYAQFQTIAVRLNSIIRQGENLHPSSLRSKVSNLQDLEKRLGSIRNLDKMYEVLSKNFYKEISYARDYLIRRHQHYVPLDGMPVDSVQADMSEVALSESDLCYKKNIESLEYSLKKIDEYKDVIESLDCLPQDVDEHSLKVNLSEFFWNIQEIALRIKKFSDTEKANEDQSTYQFRRVSNGKMHQNYGSDWYTHRISVRHTSRRVHPTSLDTVKPSFENPIPPTTDERQSGRRIGCRVSGSKFRLRAVLSREC
jgi:hypothetical protein